MVAVSNETIFFTRNPCTYCGDYASSRDHVIPSIWTDAGPKAKTFRKSRIVPCCAEYNRLLGGKAIFTIADRAHYLIGAGTHRHRKDLEAEEWTRFDLASMRGQLRKRLKAGEYRRKKQQARIAHLQEVRSLEPEIKDVWRIIDDLEWRTSNK